eukprot:scaffold91639_cov62-Phaeocystis_antarctica.AAC.5
MSRLHTGASRDAHQRRRVERQHVVEVVVPKLLLEAKKVEIGDFEQALEHLSSFLVGIQGVRALLSGPERSPEQAGGLLERWVAAWATSEGTLSLLARNESVRL